jgi:hypothetical protein
VLPLLLAADGGGGGDVELILLLLLLPAMLEFLYSLVDKSLVPTVFFLPPYTSIGSTVLKVDAGTVL